MGFPVPSLAFLQKIIQLYLFVFPFNTSVQFSVEERKGRSLCERQLSFIMKCNYVFSVQSPEERHVLFLTFVLRPEHNTDLNNHFEFDDSARCSVPSSGQKYLPPLLARLRDKENIIYIQYVQSAVVHSVYIMGWWIFRPAPLAPNVQYEKFTLLKSVQL